MIDVLLALFVLYILVFIVGLVRVGIGWSFTLYFLVLVMWYEGLDIVLTVVLLLLSFIHTYFTARGEIEEW